ncbi:MAG TPA: hypothetical protein VNC21_12760 [Vicinamibacterales bacterium]|nr:hypothetical protein [Vicinamibacterales bacterium]
MLIALLAAMVVLVAPQAAPAPQAPAATASVSGFAIRATIRMTIAKVDAPIASDAKPSPYGNFGPLIAQLLTPEGPVDIQYVITGDQSRAEVRGRLATLPRGSIVLQRVGEDSIRVLNPENKTWYEIPANQNLGVLLGTPDVDIQPVGETATIAGQRAQRFRFTETLRVPVAEGVSLPPDFPRDIQLTGDLWSTDAFAGGGYASVFKTLQAFAAIPGVEALTAGSRFPLRIALRSSIMPGYEIRSEVTTIGSAAIDPSLFVVPSGYQKVQPPLGGG